MYLSMVLAFFGANFFSFALFTVLFTSDDLEIAITLNGDVAPLVGKNRKFFLGPSVCVDIIEKTAFLTAVT